MTQKEIDTLARKEIKRSLSRIEDLIMAECDRLIEAQAITGSTTTTDLVKVILGNVERDHDFSKVTEYKRLKQF